MKAQIFWPNFSFHDGYEQFAKFFARQILPLYGISQGEYRPLNAWMRQQRGTRTVPSCMHVNWKLIVWPMVWNRIIDDLPAGHVSKFTVTS